MNKPETELLIQQGLHMACRGSLSPVRYPDVWQGLVEQQNRGLCQDEDTYYRDVNEARQMTQGLCKINYLRAKTY